MFDYFVQAQYSNNFSGTGGQLKWLLAQSKTKKSMSGTGWGAITNSNNYVSIEL
jgi:hypothetical protein